VLTGVYERAPISNLRYFDFVDPSGSSDDSFTLAIAHRENDVAVLDCVRERRPPFNLVANEFSAILKAYRIHRVTGDKYAGEWPREAFRNNGISYDLSDKDRSALYVEMLPLLNSGRIELLDNNRLISQLIALERRTGRGRDVIDHPKHGFSLSQKSSLSTSRWLASDVYKADVMILPNTRLARSPILSLIATATSRTRSSASAASSALAKKTSRSRSRS
jgi:hypothetical protein